MQRGWLVFQAGWHDDFSENPRGAGALPEETAGSMADSVAELKLELARLSAERDTLKRALEEAEVYRLAVQRAPLAMMGMSLKTGRYEFSNAAHAELLGATPQEILASDPHQRW